MIKKDAIFAFTSPEARQVWFAVQRNVLSDRAQQLVDLPSGGTGFAILHLHVPCSYPRKMGIQWSALLRKASKGDPWDGRRCLLSWNKGFVGHMAWGIWSKRWWNGVSQESYRCVCELPALSKLIHQCVQPASPTGALIFLCAWAHTLVSSCLFSTSKSSICTICVSVTQLLSLFHRGKKWGTEAIWLM